jgi:ribosomal protein L44E
MLHEADHGTAVLRYSQKRKKKTGQIEHEERRSDRENAGGGGREKND